MDWTIHAHMHISYFIAFLKLPKLVNDSQELEGVAITSVVFCSSQLDICKVSIP